ncbi:nucleotidyl transferase AbiEii/AbiGii toxin family protein [Streptomyces sp. NPDC006335]|uniref:nucleotidyl transferase AbiEii/AbiGii toxin family protein n=1 Tax=Streptomyces sp. NPDC006335 TaxID=3156895 RepID=UPI0033AE338A
MTLPDLYQRLLKDVLDSGRSYRLVLAGGYAIQAHGLVSRVSKDLDLATEAHADMNEITSSIAAGLRGKGWTVRTAEIAPRMAHLRITDTKTGEDCDLDILKEIFHQPPVHTAAGPTLSRDDAVGLKVRALHDRGLPRDAIDVFGARDLYTVAELEHLGARHKEEFDREELRHHLEGLEFTSDEGHTADGVQEDDLAELQNWVRCWLDDLGQRLAEPYTEDPDSD